MKKDLPASDHVMHQELSVDHHDPLIRSLHKVIRLAVKVLAVLMVAVILWGVADVVYVIYHHVVTPPLMFLLDMHNIFEVFASIMVVLIGIEIFINIRLYLGSNVLPIKLVVATALMAIARKIIVLDTEKLSHMDILSLAATILALGITYWLMSTNAPRGNPSSD